MSCDKCKELKKQLKQHAADKELIINQAKVLEVQSNRIQMLEAQRDA